MTPEERHASYTTLIRLIEAEVAWFSAIFSKLEAALPCDGGPLAKKIVVLKPEASQSNIKTLAESAEMLKSLTVATIDLMNGAAVGESLARRFLEQTEATPTPL